MRIRRDRPLHPLDPKFLPLPVADFQHPIRRHHQQIPRPQRNRIPGKSRNRQQPQADTAPPPSAASPAPARSSAAPAGSPPSHTTPRRPRSAGSRRQRRIHLRLLHIRQHPIHLLQQQRQRHARMSRRRIQQRLAAVFSMPIRMPAGNPCPAISATYATMSPLGSNSASTRSPPTLSLGSEIP